MGGYNMSTTQEEIRSLSFEVGSGFLLGLAIGYVLKKFFRIIMILFFTWIISLFAAEYYGIINVHSDNIVNAADHASEAGTRVLLWLRYRLESMTGNTIGLVLGFFTGLRLG